MLRIGYVSYSTIHSTVVNEFFHLIFAEIFLNVEKIFLFIHMITLKSLPYHFQALEPTLSQETLEYHYGAHHTNYVKALNNLIEGTAYDKMTLEEIIVESYQKDPAIFDNAGQIWNHTFYWESLSPSPSSFKSGSFSAAVEKQGGFDLLKEKIVQKGITQFGSGWVWLVKTKESTLDIISTPNGIPCWVVHEGIPLGVCDVWEHAYYLEYRNQRKKYLETLLMTLFHWEAVQHRFDSHYDPRSARDS